MSCPDLRITGSLRIIMIIKVKLTILTQNWNFKLFLLFLDEPGIKVNKLLGMTFQNVQFGLKENRNKARSFGQYIFYYCELKMA